MIELQKILVAVDFSRESTLAAKFAVSMAQEFKAKLYVLHVLTPLPQSMVTEVPDFDTFQKNYIERSEEDLQQVIPEKIKETIEVEEVLEVGLPQHTIVEKAKDLDVDIIVIATRGRSGLAHILLGSVAERVVRHAPCPVFAIRNPKDKFVYGWEWRRAAKKDLLLAPLHHLPEKWVHSFTHVDYKKAFQLEETLSASRH